MLSGVKLVPKEEAERAEEEDRRHHRKEHKKDKKEKKEKRKKHKKERRDRRRSASPCTSSGSEDDRREKAAPAAPAAAAPSVRPQREDWMTVPMGSSLVAPPEPKKDDAEPPSDPERAKIADRELNPYLRSSGTGMPPDSDTGGAAALVAAAPTYGDGGASWRLKALRRAQAQASEEGRALGDVVSERWGSLGDLTAELTERAAAHDMAHARAARERRGGGGKEGREGRSSGDCGGRYLSDVRSTKSQMRRPSEQNLERMSWRRDRSGSRGGSASEGGRPPSRPGDGPGGAEAVLRAAAPALNAFSNDGSFMEQFDAKQGHGEDKEAGGSGGEPAAAGAAPAVVENRRSPPPPQRDSDGEEAPTRHREHRGGHRSRGGGEERHQQQGGANLSAAAALRARLGGKPAAPSHPREETVVLPLVDAQGRAAPGAFGREGAGAAVPASGRPPKRTERYEGGERKRYFADDDNVDLDTLVKRTKYGGTEDLDTTMASNIAKRSRFKESDLDADAEYDYDGGLDLADAGRKVSKEARRRGGGAAAEEAAAREKARQVREYTRFQSALDRCNLCFTSKSRQKHLTLAIGTAAYLALPPRGRLVPGHCQIVPVEHVATTRTADEATWTEIRNFKKCLLQMFTAQGLGVIFLETAAAAPGDARVHAVVDAIPMPLDVFDKAPLYFKKAIDDATEDWAQHAAKRMIDTSVKGLRGAIPPNFPYMHVEFGLGAGFVHVIDNPAEFDRGLGRSVLVGLLNLPEEDAHRRAKRESEAIQSQWAAEFRAQFDEYDWTKQL